MSKAIVQGPTIREVGNNPAPDDQIVTHIDMSQTGLFQRIGQKLFRSTNQAAPPVAPAKARLRPEEELAELKPRLVHYERQFAAARAGVDAGNSAPIAGGNVNRQKQRLVALLDAGQDVASQPSVDSSFLASILDDWQGGGLIPTTRNRIYQLEQSQAIDKFETDGAQKKAKALARLAKATIELAAAYDAATPFFSLPYGPCLRGIPTDILRNVWKRVKHVGAKTPDDLA